MKLSFLFWDYKISDKETAELLTRNDITDWRTVSLYRRIITTFPWYDVLFTLSPDQLRNALSHEVISSIFPPSFRTRFEYVSRSLYGNR